jgi:hypothetical protein
MFLGAIPYDKSKYTPFIERGKHENARFCIGADHLPGDYILWPE